MKTYGNLAFNAKARAFVVSAEPHVIMRLKRMFKPRQHDGALHFHANEEIARDLEWALERYPLTIEAEAGERLASLSGAFKERLSLIDDLLSKRREAPPFELAIPARDYQRVAATILLAQGSLLLADDLGTGKTASAICALSDPRTRPALVVTLTHLPRQWKRELRRFAPGLRSHILQKSTPYDLSASCGKRHLWDPDEESVGGASCRRCGITRDDRYHGRVEPRVPDVIITNYHKLAGWVDVLTPIIKSVAFDEGQELRHRDTDRYRSAELLAGSAAYRLVLTATPIYNRGGEFFSLAEILRPGALGTWGEFKDTWCDSADEDRKVSIKDPKAFGTYVREVGLMLRRTREDVGRELPALTRVVHEIDADEAALDQVSDACAELARTLLRQGESKKGEKMRVAEELSNTMRQATGIAKAPYVAEFVRMLVENGEKVVLFAWHHAVYDILRDRLKALSPAFFTGAESANEKDAAKQRFVTGESSVLIMSLRAGAGLDGLQGHCRTVVFGELDWSPGVHEQAIGRVHRDGQGSPVVAYFLVASSGADPIISDVLSLKSAQAIGIKDPNAELFTKLEVAPDHMKRLAADFLMKRGESAGTEAAE